jgi:NADH dehydrogenase/NADH:ubiquinone oxidoreductase subunit G
MSETNNTISINGDLFAFDAGETILEVSRRNSIDIPTLCHLKGAAPTGTCRICVVEVQGADTLVAACATLAAAGMVVQTESPNVVEARKTLIRLLLHSGNHNCDMCRPDLGDAVKARSGSALAGNCEEICPAWGECRLQELVTRYEVSERRFKPPSPRYPLEDVNPFIVRDFSRCILCGRCVQACNEIQVNNAIEFGYSGEARKIITPGDRPLKDSDCVFCGECLQACPTGALVHKDTR